jgi:3-oxo-5-alpha-steroid 4-dehydrogenase 1
MSTEIYYYLLYAWIGLGVVSFPFLLKKTAPYGRHTSEGWGPMIPNQIGWMLMEGFAPVFISFWFWTGTLPKTNASYFFYGLYMLHYIYRSYIFPFRTQTKGKKMPLVITGSAILFNVCNTFILGFFLGNIGGNYPDGYFTSLPFITGMLVFIGGVYINIHSDNMLIKLRAPGEIGYKIPHGFLFELVSCPNLFGEIIEWTGFAIMIGGLPAWSFPIWTFINLVPRALDHHKWYLQKFPDYPKERKAVIPFIL